MIRYEICPANPRTHIFSVTIKITNFSRPEQLLRMPSWINGSYLIRDFAANVQNEEAFIGQSLVQITKTDKCTWRVDTSRNLKNPTLTVSYDVWAFDDSVRMSYLDDCRGFFNPGTVFMRVIGQDSGKLIISIKPPYDDDDHASGWRVATPLRRTKNTNRFAWGLYEAKNYDEMTDCPVELGSFLVLPFQAGGARHSVVISAPPPDLDEERLANDLRKVCEAEIAMFDPETRRAPFDEYLFLINVVPKQCGGIEHSRGCALAADSKLFPCRGNRRRQAEGSVLLALFSHEYFHAWNGKRIRPAEYVKNDCSVESPSEMLWLTEGFTSYYDDLVLRRTGLLNTKQYAAALTKNFRPVLEGGASRMQSLAEASFDAWIKYYRPTANRINAHVSYYQQGAVAALCLDAAIREKTGGERSLDDVMRLLWQNYVKEGDNYCGVTPASFRMAIDRVTGLDLKDLIDALFFTRGLPELAPVLAPLGIVFEKTNLPASRSVLGIEGKGYPEGFRIRAVHSGSAGEAASLSPGDLLIAINGVRVTNDNIDEVLSRYPAGENLSIHFFRNTTLHERFAAISQSAPMLSTVKITSEPALQKAWLEG